MFRNIPIITKNLLIINVLVYLAGVVLELRGVDLAALGGLHFFMASDFHVFQFFTYMFLHGSFTHLFFNMFALWMFGCVIEESWGRNRFLFYYIFCGVGAGLCQELVQYVSYASDGLAAYDYVSLQGYGRMPVAEYLNSWCTIGASGAVYAILLAFGMTYPDNRIFIFPLPVPIKAKWFVIGYAAIELFMALNSQGDGVAHIAHLGGMLFGFLLIRYWRQHPGNFDSSRAEAFFENMKRQFERRHKPASHVHAEPKRTATREDDMEYNARRKARQDEIDAILDKIRRSGYDSLTREEKQRLFEASREN
jgi:membrane associated rhomboid family serine protease